MTTGAPIYLVSACASGEEFISAFRRYADRNGVVFIPIASPLAPGRKGRFALTLSDGGVMVEGEAEVVSSARTPSVLYGRVGMTLKFSEPDEPSKTLLGELEKARLQMKPAPPSVAPRPAEIPAEPRAKPPAPTGRIDAVNALAECVVIGDLSTLTSDDGPKVAPKFAVPSIPPVGPGGRPRPPTGAVPVTPPLRPPSGAVPVIPAIGRETVMGMPAIEKAPAPASGPIPVIGKETVMGMPALEKAPAPPSGPIPVVADPTMPTPAKVAAAAAASGHRDKSDVLQTVRGPAPAVDLIAPGRKIDLNETMRGPAPKPTATPPKGTAPPPFTPKQPTPAAPLPVVAPPIVAARPPPRDETIDDADEPTDLTELPLVPVDQVMSDMGAAIREPRKTVIGIAVVPSGVHVLPAAPARSISEDEARDTSVMEVPDEISGPVMITSSPAKQVVDVDPLGATQTAGKKFPSGVIPTPTVEEATPSGDWTMTPGENGPTIAPRAPTPPPIALDTKPRVPTVEPEETSEVTSIPAGPATGDWMIALDPSQPDGWSEPSKIEKRPEGVLPPEPGPPVSTVASAKDLDSNAKVAPEPKLAEAAKVEVDPTLMEPLQPLQPIDDFDDEPQLPPPPSASLPGMMGLGVPTGGQMHTPIPHIPTPMPMQGPIPGVYLTPPPGQMQLASASGQVQAYPIGRYPSDSQPALAAGAAVRKRRMIVIAASAAGALLIVIILAMVVGGGKKPTDADPKATTDHAVTNPAPPPEPKKPEPPPPPPVKKDDGSGSAQPAVVDPAPPPDAAEAVVPVDAPEEIAAATECEIDFSTAPQGAEIVLDKDVIGTTPTKLTLPCGVESKLTFRKQRFVSAQRTVTPKETGQKPVRVALAKVTFTVKVSSSPPGATIFLGAKSLGITPGTVKLPAFETSTIKISKDGYAPDTQKVTPKSNTLSISATLKKQPATKKLR